MRSIYVLFCVPSQIIQLKICLENRRTWFSLEVFIFDSVWFLLKKIIKLNSFFKKTKTEPKPVQTDRFRFSFLEQKPVQTGLARFFPVWLGFFGLARFFLFFSVWFSFFSSRLKKPKPNRSVFSKF